MDNDTIMEAVRSAFDEVSEEVNSEREVRLRLVEDLLTRALERETQAKRLVKILSGVIAVQFILSATVMAFIGLV